MSYRMIFDLYSELISSATYAELKNETKALSLNDEAYSKFEDANAKLAVYGNLSKEELEELDCKEINEHLTEIHSLQTNGIGDQISAIELSVNIADKTKKVQSEDLAWKQAQKGDTLVAYTEYAENHPKGEHIYKAKGKITELGEIYVKEENASYARNNNNINSRVKNNNKQNNSYDELVLSEEDPNTNKRAVISNRDMSPHDSFVFKVQIAASEVILTDLFIDGKVPGERSVKKVRMDNWIKYFVGEFNSYQEAAKNRDKLQSTAPDAFIVVFSQGHQIELTDEMRNDDNDL